MSISICLPCSTFSTILLDPVSFLIVDLFCLRLDEVDDELLLDFGDFCTQTIFQVKSEISPKVLLLCFLGSNWSESSQPPAYINCRPVPRSHWSRTSRAATERSDWPSARVVVVWNFHGIPLHWEGQLRCVRIGANCPGPWVAKSRQIRNWVSPPILQIKPWLFWVWAHLIPSSMLEVFVLCNRGTKQLMTKGIQLPDNYSGTDEDGIESFQKWGKVLFYKT